MNQILFQILILFSKLPLKILYALSDVFFFLNFYLIGYRKKVVYTNLRNSFPEKSDAELKKIQKKFFRNFGDFLIETLKLFTISKKTSLEITSYKGINLFEKAYENKQNIIILAGHNFNWEFATVVKEFIPQENYYPIYRKLQSEFWDQKVRESRERFGAKLLESKMVMRTIIKEKNDGNSIYGFLADQSPHHSSIQFGVNFLNQATPVFTGYNRISNKNNMMVLYADTTKIKRGKYLIHFKEIHPENESGFEEYELVVKFNKILEERIKKNPENWLWTHKRWKYADYLDAEKMYHGKDYKI